MAMDSNAISKQSTSVALHNLFERLVDLCACRRISTDLRKILMIDSTVNPQGKLVTALRWRALAYKVVDRSGHNTLTKEVNRQHLLDGMRAIIDFAGANANSNSTVTVVVDQEEHVHSLFDVAKHLADMIHTGFMTAIFEVCAARPDVVYDGSWMEAWESGAAQSGTRVVCTTELGLRKLQNPLEYPFIERLDTASGKVLIKPIVLLQVSVHFPCQCGTLPKR